MIRKEMTNKKEALITGIKLALAIPALAGWWGFFYPELTLTEETCKVVSEEGTPVSSKEADSEEVYRELLMAKPEQIRFRSRLFECIQMVFTDDKK